MKCGKWRTTCTHSGYSGRWPSVVPTFLWRLPQRKKTVLEIAHRQLASWQHTEKQSHRCPGLSFLYCIVIAGLLNNYLYICLCLLCKYPNISGMNLLIAVYWETKQLHCNNSTQRFWHFRWPCLTAIADFHWMITLFFK